MISLKTLAATALIAGFAYSAASFASIGPANTPFNATGTLTISQSIVSNVACTANFVGSTNGSGTASITSASFSGSNSLCSSIKLTNLPWTLTNAGNTITIGNVSSSSLLGSCGPTNVNTSWNASASSLTIPATSLSGGCTISGTLAVQPALVVQ